MEGTPFNIVGPGPGNAGGLDKAAHVEHLLSFVAPLKENRDGVSGPYEVALCNYVLCHTCKDGWADLAVSGTALAPRINSAEAGGEIVVGVLVLGEAKGGKNPPYLLADASPEQLDKVGKDFAVYAMKMPPGKVVVDLEAFIADAI